MASISTLYADVNGVKTPLDIFPNSTGWKDVSTINDPFKVGSVGGVTMGIQYQKIANVVYIRGLVGTTADYDGNTSVTLCTLPSGYRPTKKNEYRLCAMSGANVARLLITTAGSFCIEWSRSLSNGQPLTGAVTWIDVSCNFIIN